MNLPYRMRDQEEHFSSTKVLDLRESASDASRQLQRSATYPPWIYPGKSFLYHPRLWGF